ncbi:MAG: hypothetical protein NZM02_00290, partial [Patescibacteria group bacterium]|nr:hypothetical protein [Patescibacteria group bacterium]
MTNDNTEPGLIIPGLVTPLKTPLPEDVVPKKLSEESQKLGFYQTQTSSGLSVVTKPLNLETPSQPAEPKKPQAIALTSEVSGEYLKNNLCEAIRLQLSLEEFKDNHQVFDLFQTTHQALEAIEKYFYPKIITELQAKIEKLKQELAVLDDPQKRQELQQFEDILNNQEKLQNYIYEQTEILLNNISKDKLPKEIKNAFSLINSSSMETVEQLSIVITKLISSTKEFNLPRTKKMLEVLSFVINYKGKFEKELLLPNSSAITSLLVDALRNQSLLRAFPDNWKIILQIANWLDFSPSDADEFMYYYLEAGLSMANPIITRLAFIAENKLPQGRFAQEQEKKRQIFAQAYQEAEKKGLLDLFLQPYSQEFDERFKKDINQIISGLLTFEEFITRYLPSINQEKKQHLISNYEYNKDRNALSNFFQNIQNVLIQGQRLTNQIAFAISPSQLKGKIGFEVECRVFSDMPENTPLFNLPEEFYFSFPNYNEYLGDDPKHPAGFGVEVKPRFDYLEGNNPFENAIKLSLWIRRNKGIISSESFHIHLDKTDFSDFEDFYRNRCFLLAEIRLNSLGTWEIRQLSAVPENPLSFLNSLLLGKLSQSYQLQDWQKSLFGRLSEIPTNLELFNQKLESRIIFNGKVVKLSEAIKQNPQNFRYVIESAFSSPHKEVGIVLIEKLSEAIKQNPQKFEYVIKSAFSSPHKEVVEAILNNQELTKAIFEAIKQDPQNFEYVIESAFSSPHKEVGIVLIEKVSEAIKQNPQN